MLNTQASAWPQRATQRKKTPTRRREEGRGRVEAERQPSRDWGPDTRPAPRPFPTASFRSPGQSGGTFSPGQMEPADALPAPRVRISPEAQPSRFLMLVNIPYYPCRRGRGGQAREARVGVGQEGGVRIAKERTSVDGAGRTTAGRGGSGLD
ncbi:hypothetical protein E2C01_089074 [Portunus trituberculatus]|uniref:Uncharacterized protein n=1 Tax=Portunus trituberculatus TaxID=210409 RepID=A0A5B7JL88_PORTR|nr:hypothetical protein [Portunus trituberculatus]